MAARGGVPSIHPLRSIEKRISDMLSVNAPIEKIADVLELSTVTLTRHYNHIIKKFDIKRGVKPHEPTETLRDKVKLYASLKAPQEDIARVVGVSVSTLRHHYSEELEVGGIESNLKVAANIFRMATGDPNGRNTALMAKYWGQVHLKWVEVSRIEQTGADGGPIKTENQVVVVLPSNGRDPVTIDATAEADADVDEEPLAIGSEDPDA